MKITEHEMLLTLATMALRMEDLTGHDVLEALRELGHGDVIAVARDMKGPSKKELLQIAGRSPEARESESRFVHLREPLRWFSERMEEKLRANDYKGHWSNCDFPYLDQRLDEEVDELKTARSLISPVTTETVERVIAEAADVANFAMMIADNARSKL